MKQYKHEFYKKLPQDIRESIYQGAMTLGAGFLSYDSTQIGGTGGGPVFLLGRIVSLQLTCPWLVRIATDTAIAAGLIDMKSLGNAPDGSWEGDEDLTLDENEPETTDQPTDSQPSE